MRHVLRTLLIVLAIAQLFALSVALERPANAYADPGSGLLIIQVASSMVAGALFIVRSKLRKLFHLGRKPTNEPVIDQASDIQ